MDTAINWQKALISRLSDKDVTLLNPRRKNWDPTWKQEVSNPEFLRQVNWELDGILEFADIICFYFDENTKSPITLLELGLALASNKDVVVFCPRKFWRHGNVEITCKRFNVDVIEDEEIFISRLESLL